MNEKMLKSIHRYDKKEKTYHIDVHLDNYRDVYSEWDYSPFVNRDMDEDLLEYLMSCSYEIPMKKNLDINFFLLKTLHDTSREKRSIEGIHNYFGYRIRQVKTQRFRQMRNTLTFFVIGVILLIFAVFSTSLIKNPILEQLLSEGLYIGAWVAMWEMFSIWFFHINGLNYKIKHYLRLKSSNIYYQYVDK